MSEVSRGSLRVVMPLLTLVPGGMGGSETYVRSVADGLVARPDVELTTVVSDAASGSVPTDREVVEPRVRGGGSTTARLETLARATVPGGTTRRALADAAVVHYPLTVAVPRPSRRTPVAQTLLDVAHLDLPGLFSRAERVYRSVFYDAATRRADAVITISEFCRSRIVDRLGVPASRVHVARLGVDPTRFPVSTGPRSRFVLYPARGWPHKNHERLLAAFELVREELPDLRLVLTGGGSSGLPPLPDWVEHRGLVDEPELVVLYQSAAALVFPSLYEGFGLPPLEAMAAGCPVAAATSGALPEVCGEAAVLFDPTDVPAMARAVVTAVTSRDRLVPLGLDRVESFSWSACADRHADVYHALAGR